jgi:hypothetical protein
MRLLTLSQQIENFGRWYIEIRVLLFIIYFILFSDNHSHIYIYQIWDISFSENCDYQP